MVTRTLMITALVALAAPACSDDDDVILIDPVQDAVDGGTARGNALADTAFAELSAEPNYTTVIGKTASIIAAMNDGVANQSDFAFQVVIGVDIANFAGLLIDDHDLSNADLQVVVNIFGSGFIPSGTESDVVTDYALGLDALQSTAPANIDFAFVDLQVRNHAANLVLLDQLRDMVDNDEMGLYIDDQHAMENAHLIEAEDLLATFF